MDIGVGDWVECVAGAEDDIGAIEKGRLYQVRNWVGFRRKCRYCGEPHAEGLGLTNTKRSDRGWCPRRFRPVYRPGESLFRSLLEPIDVKEDA